MKIVIAGSRNIDNFDLSQHIPSNVDLIITGGASGIDNLAEKYADKHKISKLIILPDYKRYGRAAPLRRNEIMVDLADLVIVVWDGVSRGTKYTIDYATKKGKNLKIITL